MCLGDGDGRTDIIPFLKVGLKDVGDHGSPWINSDKSLRVLPLLVGAELESRGGLIEVGDVVGVQLTSSDGQGGVDAVSTTVGADSVSLSAVLDSGDDRASLGGVLSAPVHGDGVGSELSAVGGQGDIVQVLALRLGDVNYESEEIEQKM